MNIMVLINTVQMDINKLLQTTECSIKLAFTHNHLPWSLYSLDLLFQTNPLIIIEFQLVSMAAGKYIALTLLVVLALLLYRAEEHFEHLLATMHDELDHEHYNEVSATHPDHLAVNWMSDLDDHLLISNITIPGSHNTGTYACH